MFFAGYGWACTAEVSANGAAAVSAIPIAARYAFLVLSMLISS
jgi:hypothetical protein